MIAINKTQLILSVTFVVTFAAGLIAGMLISFPDSNTDSNTSSPGLTSELNLTDDQHEAMKKIWLDILQAGMPRRKVWEGLKQTRDNAISELMLPQQQEQYARIQQEYHIARDELLKARERDFNEAIRQTRAILKPDQAEKYIQLITKLKEQRSNSSPDVQPNP